MFNHSKRNEPDFGNNGKIDEIEQTLKSMWELVTKMSDDIFEIKRSMGLGADLRKGRRTDRAITELIEIAIKQNPSLHPYSIFDLIAFHLAFSEDIDTDIYTRTRIGAMHDEVFEDETKRKKFDDWENKNKEYWVHRIKSSMGSICEWGYGDGSYDHELSIKTDDEKGEDSKIYDLMRISPDFKKFKYRMDNREIVHFGIMNESERAQCLKAVASEIDKKYINDLFEKSQSAKKDD